MRFIFNEYDSPIAAFAECEDDQTLLSDYRQSLNTEKPFDLSNLDEEEMVEFRKLVESGDLATLGIEEACIRVDEDRVEREVRERRK